MIMKANMINEITSSRRNVAGGVIFASHAMIRVIFTVVLITCLFRSTVADQLHQDRKQREEIIPKLSNQYYLKNVTSDKNNEQEFMLAPTSKTVAGGRPQVGDEQLFITSTSSVSSTTNVVTSPTSTASIESTSPSFSQTTSLSPRKQEDAKQLLIHQTASNSSSSSKSSQQLHQNHARQHRISPNERDHINESRQQSKHANDDPFYQASTSQSVTIAEPEMAASSNQEQQMQQRQKALQKQQQHKSSGGSNRWTHFGARLRPLTTSGIRDHNEAASKSLPAIVYNGNAGNSNSNNNNNMQQRSQPKQAGSSLPLNTNQVGDGDEDDDLNDDQDSEALLYKMMQQQGFLMGSPLWQQQKPGSNQGAQSADDGGQLINGDDGRESVGNSKKVIKLLKSYSHIHQVDDSDDQIRGTYTRLPVRRPAVNDNGWQPTTGGQQHNRNRLLNGRQQSSRQQPHHIFVSSQPLAKAYSQPSMRSHQMSGNHPDASDSENYPQAGSPQSGGPYGDEGSDSQGGPPPEEDEFECPNNGIFADEASGCESYHVCQSGAQVQQKFQCPKGTLFNNIILTCDFAHNVQCNKNKDANAARPEEQLDNQAYSPQQPQQVPRASVQVNQNSYMQQPRVHHQHQTAPQANSQGPRHLKIGSQYNQHQQNQPTSLAQAVSAYPPPKSASASSNSDSDDDSDDDPIVPLVPATLPPRAVAPVNLPYNPPPVAAPNMAQQAHQHQSAHRSQYPNYQSGYQQGGRGFGSYDGDSAVSPVFASHDEATRTTEASTAARSYSDQVTPGKQSSDAQSFNLVINHITPSKQQPLKSNVPLKPAVNNYNKKLANQAKHSQLVPANPPLAAYKKNEPKQQQQQHYSLPANKQAAINPHQSAANRDVLKQPARQPMHHQNHRLNSYDNDNNHYQHQRQPLATQIKAVHVEAGQPMPLRAALVDLTNDKKSGGVSSEALNDGLLLIVRHSSPAASQADVSHSPSDANKPYATGKRVNSKPATSSGQAYALDPSIVRPNSPVDAQLFPNVQKAIATAQGAGVQHHYHYNNNNNNNNNNKQHNHHNHQAAQSAHHVQHAVAPPPAQQSANSIRVSPPLPPMEPPRPVITGNDDGYYNNAELQIVASSSHTPSSSSSSAAAPGASSSTSSTTSATSSSSPAEPLPSPLPSQSKKVAAQQKADNLKPRVKRMKRLKAAQQPPTLESSRLTDAKLTKATPASSANQSQKKELKSKAANAAADQPVTVVADQQRRTG